jgi:predicted Rossmann fold nucleotide-binding protein DprA/Smf involved in DNA uptake
MGFTDIIWGKSKGQIPNGIKKEHMFTLTNLGRQQAENLEGDETEFNLIATMTTRRAWSIDDLSKETRLEGQQVRFELKRLMKQGMVKPIGASGE